MSDTDAPPEDFQEAFARIEAAVDAGDTDLKKLGFWRLVRRIKLDPMLAAHWADVAGRIDRKAFERAVRPLFPLWLGNALLSAGTLVSAAAIVYAAICDNPTVSGVLLVGSGLLLSVTVHDLAHLVWGWRHRIRFTRYFLDGPLKIEPGLKTDYATYLRATPEARAAMHAAGAIATKVAPLVPLGVWLRSDAPGWAALALAGYAVLNLVADVVGFVTKTGDWKKVRRELGIARGQRAARR